MTLAPPLIPTSLSPAATRAWASAALDAVGDEVERRVRAHRFLRYRVGEHEVPGALATGGVAASASRGIKSGFWAAVAEAAAEYLAMLCLG
jgi:hypothetical protein